MKYQIISTPDGIRAKEVPKGKKSHSKWLKAKEGQFFIDSWLRNRNTIEFLGIWERLNNPDFNYHEFDAIKN